MIEPIVLGETHLAPLHRHFINLNCMDKGDVARSKNGGNPAIYNFSAFVVELEGEWIAITAGHIFRALNDIVDQGARISDWCIDDSVVGEASFPPYPIALQINGDIISIYDEKEGYDYAAFPLVGMTRQALEQNGVRAISTETWNAEDTDQFPFWILVGTPIVFATLDATGPLVKNHVTMVVDEVDYVPENLESTNYRRLYARIGFDSVADGESGFDIGGMSGGPIFGVKSLTESYESYRIIGVQSGWNEKDHIALCAAQPFLRALIRTIAASAMP